MAQGEEEWNLVHKENVCGEKNILVCLEQFLGDLEEVLQHGNGLLSGGLAFEGSNVLPLNLASYFDIR